MSNYCRYCDDPLHNDPFKYGYAERVRAIAWLQPWRHYHKVPHAGIGGNFVATWPIVWYTREACTR